MIKPTIMVLASLLTIAQATAAPWGTDYHMGTFGAGGGSDAEGRLTLECGDPDAGIDFYGQLYLTFTPAAGASFDKKRPLTYMTFAVGAKTIDLPIETAGSGTFAYVHEGAALTQSLVSALRGGNRVRVMLGDDQLGDISLEGSSAALEAIESCIRYRS
jgi:hypothetical protein